MEFEKIEKLVRLMSSSNLTEFELEEGEEKIKLKKRKNLLIYKQILNHKYNKILKFVN